MALRCPGSPPRLLPFLWPSLCARNGSRRRFGCSRVRRAITEAASAGGGDGDAAPSRLNPAPDDYATTYFADKATLTVCAGGGGNGCISFLRDLFISEGPPNGGDGGPGGNVYIQAAYGETSLHKLARRRVVRAEHGKHGQGRAKNGRRGDDVILTVPVGTVVTELGRRDPAADEALLASAARRRQLQRDSAAASGEQEDRRPAAAPPADATQRDKWLLYPSMSSSETRSLVFPRLPRRPRLLAQPGSQVRLDLSRPTPRPILLATGGNGGLGNPHFVTSDTARPLIATRGDPGMSMKIELELKLLADVGLVGLPNTGKSTLLRALSNSRARVGSWAFTTLQPNIGTVVLDNNKGRPLVSSVRRKTTPHPKSFFGESDTEVAQRTRFTVADIPGLIEGAHLDKGLGIAFLRHVERAGVLAFVIDLGAGNAVAALKALWNEVSLYAQMREEEESDRRRDSNISWDANPDAFARTLSAGRTVIADYPQRRETPSGGLQIAAKPWFVVATKGDLPDTQENFRELRDYLTSITRGDTPHPSGIGDAWTTPWTKDCAAIPVSAINGHGVDRIVHWTVGLLDS